MDEDDDKDGTKGQGGRSAPRVVTARKARTGVQIRKKDFIDKVVAASGARKAEARAVVDATLALLADRVLAGDEVNVPPLGKLRLLKEKDTGKARIATLRLQVASDEESVTDPLAEPEE
jgi:nucleoid DNA-binding protein